MAAPSWPGWRPGAAAWVRSQLYLQVEDENEAARAMARPLDAERAYGYWYRELDPQAA